MIADRDMLVAIERAVVRGWPALETARIGGWLARWSSGGSVRANSVATVEFGAGAGIDDSLAEVTAFYRARGGTPKLNVTGTSEPAGLDAALAARGWRRSGEHVTMWLPIGGRRQRPGLSGNGTVSRHEATDAAWYGVYLAGLTADRRGIAARLVEGAPRPRAFFSCRRDGVPVASGLSVVDGALASVQCMATLPEAHRSGAASAVLAAIEAYARDSGAQALYLQTDAGNTAAVALYERFGFAIADRYHTRSLAG